jgi:adenosylhomocysteinase
LFFCYFCSLKFDNKHYINMEYKVKDIALSDFGRKEIEIAEKEMP